MSKTLKIYYLDENYINYLRKYDNRVAYNKKQRIYRKWIGVKINIFSLVCILLSLGKRTINKIYWKEIILVLSI